MNKHNQLGAINILLIPLILAVILLIGAIAFGAWAFSGRQDYKNHVDQKVAAAVTIAKQEESTQKDKDFAEAIKNPLTSYRGPSAYGSLLVQYPKTWSGYVSTNGSYPVDGYFAPGVVPSVNAQDSTFALRVRVLQQSYDQVMQPYTQQAKEGKISITPFAFKKVPSDIGSRINGQITSQKTGSLVIMPLRDKTIEIWTEAPQYIKDFDTYILPNVTFSP